MRRYTANITKDVEAVIREALMYAYNTSHSTTAKWVWAIGCREDIEVDRLGMVDNLTPHCYFS